MPTQDNVLLFQSTLSKELICELIHTGLTGDNKLKTLIFWWISVNLLIQGLVSYLLLQKSVRKRKELIGTERYCACAICIGTFST